MTSFPNGSLHDTLWYASTLVLHRAFTSLSKCHFLIYESYGEREHHLLQVQDRWYIFKVKKCFDKLFNSNPMGGEKFLH